LMVLRISGANLQQLNELRLRWYGLAVVAFVTQAGIIVVFSKGWRVGHLVVNLGTYALIGVFLWLNRNIRWLWVVALGTASNTVAMSFNGGVMPASMWAFAMTHLTPPSGFANSAVVAHPHLRFLGDVIPTPPWLPFHDVASIGDVLIVTGALLLVAHQARRPDAPRPVLEGTSSGN
jgi:hypothetical protein